MKKIGLTTTIPVEVIIAAGKEPVDLNNLFITSSDTNQYIDIAEKEGFPKSLCAWIKGIYGACIKNDIKEIVGVITGDCSNTKSLTEIFSYHGIKVYPFSYPHCRDINSVKQSVDAFIALFNTNQAKVEEVRKMLRPIRNMAIELDNLTIIGKATGFENHLWQLSCSDFNSNIIKFDSDLKNIVQLISNRASKKYSIKLAYLGVPPIFSDLYQYTESLGSQIIFNEVQREFAFPRHMNATNIYDQYFDYTYPYDIQFRIQTINEQIKHREIDAVIHYTQSFCHRAIDDIILKKELTVPVLNIEGDRSTTLDARTKLRLETFLDMINDLKKVLH